MESTLQRILEALRLTSSKDKSLEHESDCDLSTEKEDCKMERNKKVKEKSKLTNIAGKGGKRENKHIRKYGVPSKFYQRSQSLETQSQERGLNAEFMDRLSMRRNSSLDSETERFCMRYDDKFSEEQDSLWKFTGRENSAIIGNEELCGELLSEDKKRKVINGRNQEMVTTKSCFEAGKVDSYGDASDPGWKDSISTDFVTTEISSETAMCSVDRNLTPLRSTGKNQIKNVQSNSSRIFEGIADDHIQEDISGYERWINKSTRTFAGGNGERMEPETLPLCQSMSSGFVYGDHASKVADKVDKYGNINDCLSTDQPTKPIDREASDGFRVSEGSSRRQAYRLRRQERIDTTNDTETMPRTFHSTPVRESCKRKTENTFSVPYDRARRPEVWQDLPGRCEIRIFNSFAESDGHEESLAESEYETDNSAILATNPASSQDARFTGDRYATYSTGRDLRVIQSNASRRSMKLRRDSPFAFPLIEEFARKANTMPDNVYNKPGTAYSHGNQFSGNVSYFLETQQIGVEMALGNKLMQYN